MVRAAIMAAALFIAGGAIPIAGAIAMLFAPAPILIYAAARNGARIRAATAVFVAALFVSLAAGAYAGVAYLVTLGLATYLICEMLEARRPFEFIVAVTTIAILAAGGLVGLAAAGGSFDAMVAAMRAGLAESMTRGEEFSRLVGLATADAEDTRSQVLHTVLRLSPALAAMGVSLTVLLNLALFWRWAGRQRLSYILIGDLSKWSAPDWMVWVLLLTGFAWFLPVAPIQDIAVNGLLSVAAVYFCQGLAIIAFYFHVLSVPGIVRGIAYIFAVVQPVLAALVCLAGVFDLWVDFRRLRPPRQEAGSVGGDFM
jgi:uncharacterized protein YybS (DUF2232 family)